MPTPSFKNLRKRVTLLRKESNNDLGSCQHIKARRLHTDNDAVSQTRQKCIKNHYNIEHKTSPLVHRF